MESPDDRPIERFVLELLSTGSMLLGLVKSLTDELPADAYPGEEPSEVIVEMMCGTIATALGTMDVCDVRRATELIDLAGARIIEHLELACKLAERMEGGDGRTGRTYG